MLLLINKKPQKISANLPIMERYALLCSGYIQVISKRINFSEIGYLALLTPKF
jgi:hypothetical protein